MSYKNDLYQRVILDHNRNPRNYRSLSEATDSCDGKNPLCGDELTIFLELDGEVIRDISFTGSGCAISKASASLMTGYVKGKTVDEFKASFDKFQKMVKGETDGNPAELGKLSVLAGVREYSSRVKCATLAWHTASCAIEKNKATTTE